MSEVDSSPSSVLLPEEIWDMILGFVNPKEAFFFATVCKMWYRCLQKKQSNATGQWKTSLYFAVDSVPRLRWARSHDMLLQPRLCEYAAEKGRLDVLQALRSGAFTEGEICEWNHHTCVAAATSGHLDVFIWVRQNECLWDCSAAAGAAEHGHLDVLQWAAENGCWLYPDQCIVRAARNNHKDIVEWALAHYSSYYRRYLLKVEFCAAAAQGGHLQLLQWLRAQGCPWDELTTELAEFGGHTEVLQWARENGCPEAGEEEEGAEW